MHELRRIERGWAAHFICSARCRFRRNTLLEYGETRMVVSTVGNMRDDRGKAEEIGWNRLWETMVFHAVWVAPYWEADTARGEVAFDSPWALGEKANDNDADQMHETVVAEISQDLLQGKLSDEE